jgi:hypothetical protein
MSLKRLTIIISIVVGTVYADGAMAQPAAGGPSIEGSYEQILAEFSTNVAKYCRDNYNTEECEELRAMFCSAPSSTPTTSAAETENLPGYCGADRPLPGYVEVEPGCWVQPVQEEYDMSYE